MRSRVPGERERRMRCLASLPKFFNLKTQTAKIGTQTVTRLISLCSSLPRSPRMGCLFSSERVVLFLFFSYSFFANLYAKVEKSRLILHPYANNSKAQAPPVSDNSPSTPSHRSLPARAPLAPTTVRSPSPNHSPNHARTLATTPNASLPTIETLTADVASKWGRPLHTLPIAGDFPRLAKV